MVAALQNCYCTSVAPAVFDDCYFMSLNFNHVVFYHCNGESNQVAHGLGRLARFSPANTWLESMPDALISLIVNDAAIVMTG